MVRKPYVVIMVAFGPLGVAPLEREDSQLAREVRGRIGDTTGDKRSCHGSRETDVLEDVALLKFGAGRHGCFEARAKFAIRRPIALEARSRPAATASSGLALAGASEIPSASSLLRVSWPATKSSRLSGKCRKKVLLVTPARSAICATVVGVVSLLVEQVNSRNNESLGCPWFPPSHEIIVR